MVNYANKTVLVTGASKGLGHVAATAFATSGAKVFMAARTEEKLEELRLSLPIPDNHRIFSKDLTDPGNICQLANALLEVFGPPDIVIHCMGGGLGLHDPLPPAEQLDTLFRTNLCTSMELNRLLIPKMCKDGDSGRYVVHVGSTASTEAIASVGYNTIKAALAAYVRSLGNEFAPTNVVITGLLPGAFFAPGNSWEILKRDKPEIVERFVKERLPRGKIAKSEEILPLLYLLTGSGASMMAGTCIAIDAGESNSYAT